MAEIPHDLQFTWQLVSQFVSWEFCRFMSEQNENNTPETDALTFLRNMVIQRTEKPVSQVTKQELIAKVIMDIRSIKNFDTSCIAPITNSVKGICPELEKPLSKLTHHLETFYNALKHKDESRKDVIRARIEDSIREFSTEASRLLPQPDLLQVIESWSHHHSHPHPHPKPVRKIVYNPEDLENALKCLYTEGITSSEARVIAVALGGDKTFEKILRLAEAAETETEVDSLQFSLSPSSQPSSNVFSQEFAKNSQAIKMQGGALNHDTSAKIGSDIHSPLIVRVNPVQDPEMFNVAEFEENLPHLSSVSPPVSPADIHRKSPNHDGNVELQNNSIVHNRTGQNDIAVHNNTTFNHMQFAQSSANESDDNSDINDHLHTKFLRLYENRRNHEPSDPDTSDCEKNAEDRFLTPTYFKKGEPKVIYVSDTESNDSSILSYPPNSQQNDPNWSFRQQSLLPATQYMPRKRSSKKQKILPHRSTSQPVHKKIVQDDFSSDSDESPFNVVTRRQKRIGQIDSSSDIEDVPVESPRPTTSAIPTAAELCEPPTKKSRIVKKLYRSPSVCINDFVSLVRRQSPAFTDDTPPIHKATNTKSSKRKPAATASKSLKTHNCKQCPKTYKTAKGLRSHVFVKHTAALQESD